MMLFVMAGAKGLVRRGWKSSLSFIGTISVGWHLIKGPE